MRVLKLKQQQQQLKSVLFICVASTVALQNVKDRHFSISQHSTYFKPCSHGLPEETASASEELPRCHDMFRDIWNMVMEESKARHGDPSDCPYVQELSPGHPARGSVGDICSRLLMDNVLICCSQGALLAHAMRSEVVTKYHASKC